MTNIQVPAVQPINPVASVATWADALLADADPFLAAIQGAQGRIPEWPAFLVDAQRLREAAANFRNDAAMGKDVAGLAYEFRDVDAAWQRLSRRLYRVSKGQQIGPNIEAVKRMGVTLGQIHQALGMPGYAPNVP